MGNQKPDISVIVPVYGVEKYIERCVRSLMEQTHDNMEFIFVDDCTPDRSIEIAKSTVDKYPDRKGQVKWLRHEMNRGLPAARNTGLNTATGSYIYHCDSDDYLDSEMLEMMFIAARRNDADYVWCDWVLSYNSRERQMLQTNATTTREAIRLTLAGCLKYNVWNKLVNRKIYEDNSIIFPDGRSMGEDMTMIRLLACSERITSVSGVHYHYIRTNADAMTRCYSEKHLKDLRQNIEETTSFLLQKITDDSIFKEVNWFLLNAKLHFLFTNKTEDFKTWQYLFSESNAFIMSNSYQSFRARILQWCAAHKLWFINQLYNTLLFNIVYGKIFK